MEALPPGNCFAILRRPNLNAMKLKEMCEAERPREKMLNQGPSSLGVAELLAILLRTGTTNDNVIDISHRLLSMAGGSLLRLSSFQRSELCSLPGIKDNKAVTLMAAFELGRRYMAESSYLPSEPVTTADAVYKMMIPYMKGLAHEECWIVPLNSSQLPLGRIRMTTGGGDSTTIDVRDIIRKALDVHAKSLILVHNHPSGNPEPGVADIQETKALKAAAESMDLLLLDHVVICDDCFFSFADERVTRV